MLMLSHRIRATTTTKTNLLLTYLAWILCRVMCFYTYMTQEKQRKEDLDLHYLRQRIKSMVSDYNNRAENLDLAREQNGIGKALKVQRISVYIDKPNYT